MSTSVTPGHKKSGPYGPPNGGQNRIENRGRNGERNREQNREQNKKSDFNIIPKQMFQHKKTAPGFCCALF
ncbi:MAG: hypothetical protein OEX07_14210 [Gammaproteobacteria bacterium]|nr:hypothetical protein [Gammaproteobacteria bacterium]